jgi:hypothetical protein
LSAIGGDEALAKASTQPETMVLVRRGPDGMGRQRIDCDANMQLIDPAKDQSLRNGDQLIVMPAAPAPDGLQRPASPGIPVSQ